jgi:hypothetical protein
MKLIIKSCLVGLTLLVSSVSQAAIISVDSPVAATVGDSFAVDVLIEDVNDLAGFQFSLGFDSNVLSAATVTSGNIFGFDTFLIDSTISAGAVSFSEVTFALSGLDIIGSSLLATINFDAIASGMSALSLSDVILSDSLSTSIVPVFINEANITVNSPVNVPAPASLLMLLAGLSIFVAMRKNKRSF